RPVIALDEPFAALDALSRIEARNWLLDALPEAGRTVLLVTHDVEEAAILADRILVLSKRPASVIAEIAPASAAPRDRTSDEVLGSREQILAFLGVEG
ncbi:MAG: ABC transporter ATP-binding protein, partial [Actinomycetes bacterium]